jgi:RNA recognition motif-containing protein
MGNKIYVGNLPFKVGNDELKDLFAEMGEVTEATVIVDKFSKRSKGFGFVTFAADESAAKAVEEMNEKEVEGRNIKVSEARPMERRD